MADKKISDLTSISSTDVASADIIPIVDITAGLTKSITISNLKTSIFSSPTFTGVVTFQGSITDANNNLALTGEQLSINSDQAAAINIDSFSTGNSAIFRVNAVTDTVSTANLTTSGDLTVNTSAPDSPPNSPFSAPVFIVDSSTERVGINKAIPDEALDVVGNIKATGGITGTTLYGSYAYVNNVRSPENVNLSINTGAGGDLSIGATAGPSSGGDVNITDINNISGVMGDINLKTDSTAKIQVGGGRADIFNVSSTTDGFGPVFNISAASSQKISNYVLAEFSAGINVTGDSKFVNALGIGRDPSGGHSLAVNGNADVGSTLSSNTFETTQATISGNLVVNTNAADSPPNSPFSAPVFKVDSLTEKVGINKSIPAVELDVVGDVTATGSITGATLGGTLSTAAQPNITSVGELKTLSVKMPGDNNPITGHDGKVTCDALSADALQVDENGSGMSYNQQFFVDIQGDTIMRDLSARDITLDQGGARTIKIARVTTGENGNNLTIEAGQFESGTEGNGGSLTLKGGSGDSGDGSGGDLILQPGAGETEGVLQIKGSNFQLDSTSAQSAFRSAIGAGTGTYDNGSIIKTNTIQTHASAILNIYGSSGTTAYPVNITGGSESGDTGSAAGVNIAGGTSGADGGNGGDVTIQGGSGETTNGKVILGGSNTLQIDVNSTLTATGIIKSERLNVNSGKLYVDDNTTNYSVKIGAYGQGTFFGKDGSVNGAQYSLAVGSAGKIVEDLKVETFKITGNGFLNLHTAPKTLIASPGAGKVIIVHQVTFFVDYGSGGATSSSRGTGSGGWDGDDPSADGGCYGVGFSPTSTYSSSNEFYSAAGLPRNVVHSESGNFFWTGEPDSDFRVKGDRALILRSTSVQNISSSSALPVGASHYIKIRYQVLNISGDFQNIAGLTTISS